MSRAFLFLPSALVLLLGATACEKKLTQAQLNAEREKAWRIQQKARAVKAYQELIKEYPDSPFVEQAKQRVQAIGPVATPKPAAKK